MAQLSGMDNLFLADEEGSVYHHVSGLGIYDPSSSPKGKTRFKEILQHFENRLGDFPIFRRRPVSVPFGLDRPYWVEDQHIDVEFHIRHLALPKPGDWRQLMIQVARLHSRPLDRSRPLWEIYVIEGLDNIAGFPAGCFALFFKFHHSAVDGHAATEVIRAIHGLDPLEVYESIGREPENCIPPSSMRMLANASKNSVLRMVDLGGTSLSVTRKLGSLLKRSIAKPANAEGEAVSLLSALSPAPKTRFGGRISAHRAVDAVSFPNEKIKNIRQNIPGTTINDVFMSVIGGALREYLSSKEDLPGASLRGAMPISLHGKVTVKGESGNHIGIAMVELGTDIEDALDRLHSVHHAAKKAKDVTESLGFDLMHKLMGALPEVVGRGVLKTTSGLGANVTVSNVRGPDVDLYVAGAKMLSLYPVNVVTDKIGLSLTGFSYNGALSVCFVSCRDMMSDPAYFAELLNKHFAELCAAADQIAAKAMSKPRARAKATASAAKAPARKSASKEKPLPAAAPVKVSKAAKAKVVPIAPAILAAEVTSDV